MLLTHHLTNDPMVLLAMGGTRKELISTARHHVRTSMSVMCLDVCGAPKQSTPAATANKPQHKFDLIFRGMARYGVGASSHLHRNNISNASSVAATERDIQIFQYLFNIRGLLAATSMPIATSFCEFKTLTNKNRGICLHTVTSLNVVY